jgi:hypothetical protein
MLYYNRQFDAGRGTISSYDVAHHTSLAPPECHNAGEVGYGEAPRQPLNVANLLPLDRVTLSDLAFPLEASRSFHWSREGNWKLAAEFTLLLHDLDCRKLPSFSVADESDPKQLIVSQSMHPVKREFIWQSTS